MEYYMKIEKEYLYFPIQIEGTETKIEISTVELSGEIKKQFEFYIPVVFDESSYNNCDYFARFPVKKFTDKTIILKGIAPEDFFVKIQQDSLRKCEKLERPSIHFTSEHSWINDPNGLVYQDGTYHLYYQYNPFHIKWNNMSWGHAVSKDLLHFEELDPVLYPDEEGMIFSGSAITNKKENLGLPKEAILYFYTAAGGITDWSKDKVSVQKLAFSIDQGKTIEKINHVKIETIEKENRDPKIFWHEESQAYIICLWLQENEFAILRSKDLKEYTISQRFSLKEAWECPDLFSLVQEDGTKQWIFWTADGFYYFGSFDGYEFITDGIQRKAHVNQIPYAAQTFSGLNERILSISWLRLQFEKRFYTGAMAIPKELKLKTFRNSNHLVQQYTKEFYAGLQKKQIPDMIQQKWQIELERNCASYFQFLDDENNLKEEDFMMDMSDSKISYNRKNGLLKFNQEEYLIGPEVECFEILIDDVICEILVNYGIMTAVFELKQVCNQIQIQSGSYQLVEYAKIQ